MGRWYCCNDSFVSLSNLQEVLSEKVYILFFSRSNQRPSSASNIFHSNGVKSRQNGKEVNNGVKASVPLQSVRTKPSVDPSFPKDVSSVSKVLPSNGANAHQNGNAVHKGIRDGIPSQSEHTKLYTEQSSQKDVSTDSKVEKVPSNSKLKFSISGISGQKLVPTTSSGKENVNNQKMQLNGVVKDSFQKDSNEKVALAESNGSNKSKRVDNTNRNCNSTSPSLANGSDTAPSVASNSGGVDPCEGLGMRYGMTTKSGADHSKLVSNGVNSSDVCGSKRIREETCSLLAHDFESRLKVEELKRVYVLLTSKLLKFLHIHLTCAFVYHFIFLHLPNEVRQLLSRIIFEFRLDVQGEICLYWIVVHLQITYGSILDIFPSYFSNFFLFLFNLTLMGHLRF